MEDNHKIVSDVVSDVQSQFKKGLTETQPKQIIKNKLRKKNKQRQKIIHKMKILKQTKNKPRKKRCSTCYGN